MKHDNPTINKHTVIFTPFHIPTQCRSLLPVPTSHARSNAANAQPKLKQVLAASVAHVNNYHSAINTRGPSCTDIRPSTIPNAGLGLFTLQEFKSGDLIVPYKGEILTRAQMDERYGNGLATYALQINKNTYIDSACARGTASFINTFPRHNNARFSVHSGRAGHPPGASVRATKKIPAGSEIFVDYGPDRARYIPPKAK